MVTQERHNKQSLASCTKQAQQVWSPINLRHGHVGVFSQDLRVLRPLEFVQELCAQHDVEVLANPCHHFVDCKLPKEQEEEQSGGLCRDTAENVL